MSQKRLNDSIIKSLKEIKKNLRRKSQNQQDNPERRSKKKFKSSSLHTIQIEVPLCESNKTKATFTESPPQSLPCEPDLMLALYDDKLSSLEKLELKEYKNSDNSFLVYHSTDIPSRTQAPEDTAFDDERGDYIVEKGTIIYYR